MSWLLLGVLSTVGAVLVASCIVVLFVRHRFHRHHRVDPAVPTPAPASWAADPRPPARLHRRLARVGRAAAAVADDHRVPARRWRSVDQPPLVGVAEDLRAQAVLVDGAVARLALLAPAARRPALAELAATVAELEGAASRLVTLSAQVRTPPVLAHEADDVTDVAAQIARLADAHRELLALDAEAGLAAGRVGGGTGSLPR